MEIEATDVSEFVDFMVGLFHERTLNARRLCIATRFAAKAGIAEAAKVGCKPGAQSGKYNAHLKRIWKTDTPDGSVCTMSAPSHGKHDLSRRLHDVSVYPPHELVARELAEGSWCNTARRRIHRCCPPRHTTITLSCGNEGQTLEMN